MSRDDNNNQLTALRRGFVYVVLFRFVLLLFFSPPFLSLLRASKPRPDIHPSLDWQTAYRTISDPDAIDERPPRRSGQRYWNYVDYLVIHLAAWCGPHADKI